MKGPQARTFPNSHNKILAGQTHNVSQEVLAPVLIDFYLKGI